MHSSMTSLTPSVFLVSTSTYFIMFALIGCSLIQSSRESTRQRRKFWKWNRLLTVYLSNWAVLTLAFTLLASKSPLMNFFISKRSTACCLAHLWALLNATVFDVELADVVQLISTTIESVTKILIILSSISQYAMKLSLWKLKTLLYLKSVD